MSKDYGFGAPCDVNLRTELKCKCCVVHLYRWADALGKRKSGPTHPTQ